jgi:hypothetical protein
MILTAETEVQCWEEKLTHGRCTDHCALKTCTDGCSCKLPRLVI